MIVKTTFFPHSYKGGMLQWNVKSSSMPNLPSKLLHIQWANRFVFRGQSMKFQWNESITFFLHRRLQLSPHSPHPSARCVPLDSSVIAAPVTTLSSFSTSAPPSNTRRRWLFSFRILVHIALLDPSVGSRGVMNNICPAFKNLFTLQEEVGEGRGGWVHSWNSPERVCKKREGEGPH